MTNSRAEQQVPVQIGSVLYLPTPRSPYPLFCQAPADAGCPVPCQLADKGYSHFVVVVGIYLMEDTDETYDKISFVQMTSEILEDTVYHTQFFQSGLPPEKKHYRLWRDFDEGFLCMPHTYIAPAWLLERRRFNGNSNQLLPPATLRILLRAVKSAGDPIIPPTKSATSPSSPDSPSHPAVFDSEFGSPNPFAPLSLDCEPRALFVRDRTDEPDPLASGASQSTIRTQRAAPNLGNLLRAARASKPSR